MNFLSTGVKEVTRRLRRSKNRLALATARKSLDRADTALGRHSWRDLVGDAAEDTREAFANLHALSEEVEAAQLRIAELEAEVRAREADRESARRDHAQAVAAIEEEREPIQERLAALRVPSPSTRKSSMTRTTAARTQGRADRPPQARTPRPRPEPPAHRLGTRRTPEGIRDGAHPPDRGGRATGRVALGSGRADGRRRDWRSRKSRRRSPPSTPARKKPGWTSPPATARTPLAIAGLHKEIAVHPPSGRARRGEQGRRVPRHRPPAFRARIRPARRRTNRSRPAAASASTSSASSAWKRSGARSRATPTGRTCASFTS